MKSIKNKINTELLQQGDRAELSKLSKLMLKTGGYEEIFTQEVNEAISEFLSCLSATKPDEDIIWNIILKNVVSEGYIELVELLLAYLASIDKLQSCIEYNYGKTGLNIPVGNGYKAIAKWLIEEHEDQESKKNEE